MMPGREGPPGLELESSERAAAVEDCVSRLPVELRRIVELRYVGERTTRDIAAAAGISEASVRNRLSEARDALAQCLGRKGVL
jgi:RNA polymerase sigma factor (sigma-70 family)